MARYHYAACTPTWDTPRNRTLEWTILYLFVIDIFCQCMSAVPVIGYGCWLAELVVSLTLFVLLVMLLRARR